MSEETADAKGLFNNEVRIKGTVIAFERKVGKSGKDWGLLTLGRSREFGGQSVAECYDISVFGKAFEEFADVLQDQDTIETVCRLQADLWKERYYLKLSLKSAKCIKHECSQTESGTAETPVRPVVEDDANLPF